MIHGPNEFITNKKIKMATVYQNNEVRIYTERANEDEARVQVNGENLIWISLEEEEEFISELTDLLDKYRI